MGAAVVRMEIMAGLPLSGKTTIARQLRAERGYAIICPDDIRIALHGRAYYQPAEAFVWAAAELMASALILGGQSVIVDATNTTAKRRLPWLQMAKRLQAESSINVVDTPAGECARRAKAGGNPYMLEIIARMADQWEPITDKEIDLVGGVIQQ